MEQYGVMWSISSVLEAVVLPLRQSWHSGIPSLGAVDPSYRTGYLYDYGLIAPYWSPVAQMGFHANAQVQSWPQNWPDTIERAPLGALADA